MAPRSNVTVLCGGRGSASLLRELLRQPGVDLTLLINAYDDGLSTGTLRRLVPGMLGPSDFRKNLSLLLDLHSRQQFQLARLLEHRLAGDTTFRALDRLIAELRRGAADAHTPLGSLLLGLDRPLLQKLGSYLATFRAHAEKADEAFPLAGCAFGNLLFVGAYLQNGESFNAAVRELSSAMGCDARLINVTSGENRVLVAVKENGELLLSEAAIVGPQSPARISGIFLLEAALSRSEIAGLGALDVAGKLAALAEKERPVSLSAEAREAIERSDMLVYGAGTQFSSLFPSYKTRGLREAIEHSKAKVRALVVNLRADHDIQSLTAMDIVDEALRHLGDETNAHRTISHVLASVRGDEGGPCPAGVRPEGGRHRGALWVENHLENTAYPGLHNGHKTARALFALLREPGKRGESLDVYIDLRERAPAARLVVQELSELDWARHFADVVVTINQGDEPEASLPAPLRVATASRTSLFSEVEVFRDWLSSGTSDYLVTLAGDGEYRLADVLLAISVLRDGSFGVVFGSRNQSRTQMYGSLAYAYSQTKTLYWGSWLGAYVFSGVFALRYRFLSSDPFTAFRVYRRSVLAGLPPSRVAALESGTDVSKLLLGAGVEIAEIPIHHRTFRGFTNVRTRLARGLRNAIDSLR